MGYLLLSEESMLYDRMRLFNLSPVTYPVLYHSSAAQIELLQLLVQIASENNLGEGVIVKIKFNIITSLYDYNPNLATYMKVRAVKGSIPGLSWDGWVRGRCLVSSNSGAVETVLVVEGICLFHLHTSD